jgi:ribosomal protection tetracycline resistance protein
LQKTFNVGILAHVDAGKTTITENLLFLGGAIRKKGSVDSGSAITDSLEIEQKRGISVRSATVSFQWNSQTINLIDTPGHADFSAEVERVLRVLDGVVLVVSAVEGIQAHTFTLWQACQDLDIPVLVFVNKVDRAGSDYEGLINALKKEFKVNPVPVYGTVNEGLSSANIIPLWNADDQDISSDNQLLKNEALESIADYDEEILERYLEDLPIKNEDVLLAAKRLIAPQFKQTVDGQKKIVPVFTGVAKSAIGIEALLNGIIEFLPAAKQDTSHEASALVFKIEHDKTAGRLAHIRLFSGVIHSKDSIYNDSQKKDIKLGLVQKVYTTKQEIIGTLKAGDIGVITGLQDVNAGDILGSPEGIKQSRLLQTPVITTQVKPIENSDYNDLGKALQIINSEDPALDFKWYKSEREMHLRMMGPMQIEVLESILQNRFGIDVEVSDPAIIYKETPITSAEGYVRYWMPKPCWAIMTFLIEPGPRGSGITYESSVRQSDIHKKYQNEIEKTIPKALEQGIKGWEVTDIKISLIEGSDHEMHSRPGDFALATPMGILRGLENAGTTLLEPILDFEIKAGEEALGRITGELTQMRAQFANPTFEDGQFTLKGKIPAATSIHYSIQLSSTTGGKGRLIFKSSSYDVCPEGEGAEKEFIGVNPLNESQWILHRRGAYKADERKL